MTAAILIIDEEEDENTRQIIDYIADNIDKVILMYDIKILKVSDIEDVKNRADVRDLPCLHVDGINYHKKRDILSMLKAGKIEKSGNGDYFDNIIRDLSEMPEDELCKPIIEDNTQQVLEDTRSRRFAKDIERRSSFSSIPTKRKTAPPPEVSDTHVSKAITDGISHEVMLKMMQDDGGD